MIIRESRTPLILSVYLFLLSKSYGNIFTQLCYLLLPSSLKIIIGIISGNGYSVTSHTLIPFFI